MLGAPTCSRKCVEDYTSEGEWRYGEILRSGFGRMRETAYTDALSLKTSWSGRIDDEKRLTVEEGGVAAAATDTWERRTLDSFLD